MTDVRILNIQVANNLMLALGYKKYGAYDTAYLHEFYSLTLSSDPRGRLGLCGTPFLLPEVEPTDSIRPRSQRGSL